VYLDLIGLPPTPAEADAFVNDPSPDAYEKVVDQLLASPQYGERWGRHFLDVWRYSDWWGLGAELRNSQRHIWHWRDWTIESFNADLGYDEMIRQMLAADELYPTDPKKLRATGYLARSYFLFNRTSWLDEVVEHTGKGFLGLTFNCSKCHDHKYDPIKQSDYYQFRAIFEPYQLRTDLVPGELDATKDGIPRAYDANGDAKTPFHIRGDERNPDKDRVVLPGLPQFLATDGLKITPVKLPPLAYRPGARTEIVAAYKKAAEAKLASAKTALAAAKAESAKVAKTDPPAPDKPRPKPAEAKVLVKDDFAKPNPDVWETGPGMWKHEKGKLLQQKPDGERSHIRAKSAPPPDFDAAFQFTIIGGDPYRSVGVAFDVAEGSEFLVYVSAGGGKLQVAHKSGGNYVYPAESAVNLAIPVNKPLELRVRVRGSLLNVAYNGAHVLAYTLPVARKAGKLDLITYTATAEFTGFTLRELPADYELISPKGGAKPAPLTPEIAAANVLAAEKAVAAAEAELASIDARAKAETGVAKEDAKAAAKAEKLAAVQAAELALAQADAEVKKAAPAVKAAAEQKRKAAEGAVTAARKAAESPGETYTPIPGAVRSAESNLDSKPKFGPFPDTSTGRRTALANWIAGKDNPLTARVAVNHVWMRHFGKPLVANVFEFGRKGTPPTHPELLDWLAAELMANKWSFKHLHKLIVTSETYRLSSSSANADANLKIDPENLTLWRMNSTRMEAQTIRDSLLHLAGDLDLTMGGPPVPPAAQDASRRRAMYFFHSHNEHNKLLDIFDNANVLECYRRSESIVPQQALALWNSRLAQTSAAKINDALHAKLKDADDARFVTLAFELVLGTSPTKDELATCVGAMAELRAELKAVPAAERTKRVRLQVVQALVNHNDFVTVR
jgi:hypothetical protein